MIYTFYSYKGGVGRSMALANVAELMYQAGLRVVVVDWDLEAPGLERFFFDDVEHVRERPGLMDLLLGYKERMSRPRREEDDVLPFEELGEFLVDVHPGGVESRGALTLLSAGRRAGGEFGRYANTVRAFDWQDFYANWEGELFFEWLRRELEKAGDVVLIDSRTGVTEMGGVSTYQLTDVVVMLCAANRQSLEGTLAMARDFRREEVRELRGREVRLLVVPARIENAEAEQLDRFKQEFLHAFADFVPPEIGATADAFWALRIPYIPFYAFSERLAVRERRRAGAEDLANAFNLLMERMAELDLATAARLHPVSDRPVLRLVQESLGGDRYRVEITSEGNGRRRTATVSFRYGLTAQDREDIRWYLEDFLEYPADPAPKIARRVERRIEQLGAELFAAVFGDDPAARELWHGLRQRLTDLHVEVAAGPREAGTLPWELMREDAFGTPLALCARSFVRTRRSHKQPLAPPPPAGAGPIRILLVICRPGGRDDVPFRSVAGRLIKGLTESAREAFQLEVLRPPTFDQLGRVLRGAKAEGRPYHIVHFDGHGAYADPEDADPPASHATKATPVRPGQRGYLLFENPGTLENVQRVDGARMGRLLAETGVPVLVLNTCRSAHAEAPVAPLPVGRGTRDAGGPADPLQAFSSLAQEVMDQGVSGVVAMRYNVYVVTAAQFTADLYAALAQGSTLGEAVTQARKQLHDQPLREMAREARTLEDWLVPVVYEAAPISLFAAREGAPSFIITVPRVAARAGSALGNLPRADASFMGRDETILALDRAFDTQPIVLLHAPGGSGKTATAAEFARWYTLTGGMDGPVLFTSLAQHRSLSRVLDTLGEVFDTLLAGAGVQWPALPEEYRASVALQALQQVPLLWVWDDVDAVAGVPGKPESAWTEREQAEVLEFLRAARETRARFLLTSRRDERAWLGDVPARVALPPMTARDAMQLVRALAQRQGRSVPDLEAWQPVLAFARGNPLTLTLLVRQALHERLRTRQAMEGLVERLRAGEAALGDETGPGSSATVEASLAYGFDDAFTQSERRHLALLHLFQGFVDVDVLVAMFSGEALATPVNSTVLRYLDLGQPVSAIREEWPTFSTSDAARQRDRASGGAGPAPGGLTGGELVAQELEEESRGAFAAAGQPLEIPGLDWLTRDEWIILLERAAALGFLDRRGGGYYSIHPALSGFLKRRFDEAFPDPGTRERLARAYVQTMGSAGAFYHRLYHEGRPEVVELLTHEEPNLMRAWRLARENEWWGPVIATMQGLRTLYEHTGRREDWAQMVEAVVPSFVGWDDGPLPGRDAAWRLVTEYRVRLAREARDLATAQRLQQRLVESDRRQVEHGPAMDEAVRNLAVSLEQLGHILREADEPDCVRPYQEARALYEQIGDRAGAAAVAFNLGSAYLQVEGIHDLAQAQTWFERSLDTREGHDPLGRARVLGQLGYVAYQRFLSPQTSGEPDPEQAAQLGRALELYQEALRMIPPDARPDIAIIQHQLALIYTATGELDVALLHFREALRCSEALGDMYMAAPTRLNIAVVLGRADRLQDAREYAHAALDGFLRLGNKEGESAARMLAEAIDAELQSREAARSGTSGGTTR